MGRIWRVIRFIALATLLGPWFGPCAVAAAPVDLGRLRQPVDICRALASLGLDAGPEWRTSAARPDGWVCSRTGVAQAFGAPGPDGLQNRLAYFVYGSGPTKIDRIMLQLDVHAPGSLAEGRGRLRAAAEVLAGRLGITLPQKVAELIETHPVASRPDWRPSKGNDGRHLLHEERKGWIKVRLEAEETRLAALIVSFVNPEASGIWFQGALEPRKSETSPVHPWRGLNPRPPA